MAPSPIYNSWTIYYPTILMCTVICSIVLLFRLSERKRSDGALPPSPWRLPLIGNLHQLTVIPCQGLYALSNKSGPLMLMHFGSKPFYVISSGDLAKDVAITHDAIFSNRSTTKASRMLFSGGEDILFSPENKFWRLAKKLCVHELLSTERVQSFRNIREEEASRLVRVIKSSCLGNQSGIDLSRMFLTLASNTVSRAVLGLESGDDYNGDGYVKAKLAIQGAHIVTELFTFEDYIPALAWLDHLTGLNRKLKTTFETIHNFVDKIIDERKILLKNGNVIDRKCFLDIILELQDKDMIGIDLSRNDIRSILLDMFVAAIATSTAAMEWAMSELARNPIIMKKVQDEVRSIVGQKSKIQEDDISQMEYLKCVIKESLRLHGVTMAARETYSSDTIGGFKIPANATMLINIYTIHRDPTVWDTPSEFIPERFLNSSYNFKGQDTKYFPFGLGKRICPGGQFAMAKVECALANVLCWFDWELPDGMGPKDLNMDASSSLTSHRTSPLRLVPKPVPGPFISA